MKKLLHKYIGWDGLYMIVCSTIILLLSGYIFDYGSLTSTGYVLGCIGFSLGMGIGSFYRDVIEDKDESKT